MSDESTALVAQQAGELSVQQVLAQATKIQEVMKAVMHKDEHYGVIPGTKKPSLLKAGAEKLCLVFRLDPQYSIVEKMEGDHLTVFSTCTLFHIPTGNRMGSGMGSCSTKEQKYAYRQSGRACPSCGVEGSIRKSKQEWGGGWYCSTRDGGCNAKFTKDDSQITAQDTARVANPDIADQYNTVLKMANKRSLIAGVLNVTAASDLFTQDLEDLKGKRSAAPEDEGGPDPSDTFHPESEGGVKTNPYLKQGEASVPMNEDLATTEQVGMLVRTAQSGKPSNWVQWLSGKYKNEGIEFVSIQKPKNMTKQQLEMFMGELLQEKIGQGAQ